MSQSETALDWVRFAETYWWNPPEILMPIRLSEHVGKILNVLEQADRVGDEDRVWQEIDRVRKKYITMSRFEAGVSQQRCAKIALKLGYVKTAFEMFYDSRDNLSRGDSHHYAVASWMLGVVYWLGPTSRHNKAIDVWQEAIDIFDRLGNNAATNTEKMRWYREARAIMVEALKLAIELEGLPDLHAVAEVDLPRQSEPVFVGEVDIEPEPEPEGQPIPIENYFELFVVYDEIPAGLPAMLNFIPTPRYPAHPDLEPDEFLEVTRLRMGGKEYLVQSLKRVDRRVSLVNDWQYYCLKVRGSSMNLAGVNDGDLVLLRYQKNADSGDIVAAVLIDEDDPDQDRYATFKRFVKQGKQISLRAESDDQTIKDWERTFTQTELDAEEKIIIYGIAVAVLKPV